MSNLSRSMDGLKPCQFRQVDNHGRILCGLIKSGDREVSVNLCRACPVPQINCQHLRASLEKNVSTPLTVRYATGRVEVWDDNPPTIDFKQAACSAKTMPIQSPRDCSGCPIRLPNVIPQNAIQVAHRGKTTEVLPQEAIAVSGTTAVKKGAISRQRAGRAAQVALTSAVNSVQVPTPSVPVAPTSSRGEISALSDITQTESFGTSSSRATETTDLIARAQATARQKAQERAAQPQHAAAEQQANYPAAVEPKPKIIQLQAWLAAQVNRKQVHQPMPVEPDAEGVSEIVYAPLGGHAAQAYQENIDYERCVGWTD
jgi:hypothetical protein